MSMMPRKILKLVLQMDPPFLGLTLFRLGSQSDTIYLHTQSKI